MDKNLWLTFLGQPVYLCIYLFRHRISELRRPTAVKLCHVITIWVRFTMQVQKFGDSPLKKFEAKNMQNLARFYTTFDFDREYLRNEISKMGKICDHKNDSSCVRRNKSDELWSTTQKVGHCEFGPTQIDIFGRLYFGPYWVLATEIFTRARDWPSAHHKPGRGCPPLKIRAKI